ncbi:MAG: hypothetical protein HYY76_04680, partial [Acidobacteria bacterium]|nr:hypothetical protein [Acidobacteriota bacterium]
MLTGPRGARTDMSNPPIAAAVLLMLALAAPARAQSPPVEAGLQARLEAQEAIDVTRL